LVSIFSKASEITIDPEQILSVEADVSEIIEQMKQKKQEVMKDEESKRFSS